MEYKYELLSMVFFLVKTISILSKSKLNYKISNQMQSVQFQNICKYLYVFKYIFLD